MTRVERIGVIGACLDDAVTFGRSVESYVRLAANPLASDALSAKAHLDAVMAARFAWSSGQEALRHLEALEQEAAAPAEARLVGAA